MKQKRHTELAVIVVCVLVLLAAAAWYSSQPNWQPMPESLTKPSPDIDRSRIPLGPYTVDFSGLIGGPTGDKRVTFYVVMRPGDVHLQRVGEVGKKLAGASVIGLGIRFLRAEPALTKLPHGEQVVDGLKMVPESIDSYPIFETRGVTDALDRPLRITCYLGAEERALIARNSSFQGVETGMCTATFWFASDLFVVMDGIQPAMFPSMSQFLPDLYEVVSNRIQGEP